MKYTRSNGDSKLRRLYGLSGGRYCFLKIGAPVLFFALYLSSSRVTDRERQAVSHFQSHERGKCTLVFNGFSRVDTLIALTVHYSAVPVFAHVVINWGNPLEPPHKVKSLVVTLGLQHRVTVVERDEDDLNTRFQNSDIIRTECVVIADDDIFIEEDDLVKAYRVWAEHSTQIVGFFPRSHNGQQHKYVSDPVQQYSMILTKFMLIHRKYLTEYYKESMEPVRRYISSVKNCEDIAMNFLVGFITSKPPIYIESYKKLDLGGFDGLYKRPNHAMIRDECVASISKLMGYPSLPYTSLKYDVFERDRTKHGSKSTRMKISAMLKNTDSHRFNMFEFLYSVRELLSHTS